MPMNMMRLLGGFFFIAYALQIHGATVVHMEVQVGKNNKSTVETNIITVDGEKIRVDYLGEETEKTDVTPFLLTIDNGKTWILGNEGKGEFYCAAVDMKEYFRDLGEIIARVDSFANVKITNDKVVNVLEESGPEILGNPSIHIRLETTADIKASILIKRYKFKLRKVDDIWYARDREMHIAKKRWIEALTHSGYEKLDNLSSQARGSIPGAILKQETEIKITNVKEDEIDIYTRKINIRSIEDMDSSAVPEGTFVPPECDGLDKKQMKDVTKTMFGKGKFTL
jgi:hypothetical protein